MVFNGCEEDISSDITDRSDGTCSLLSLNNPFQLSCDFVGRFRTYRTRRCFTSDTAQNSVEEIQIVDKGSQGSNFTELLHRAKSRPF